MIDDNDIKQLTHSIISLAKAIEHLGRDDGQGRSISLRDLLQTERNLGAKLDKIMATQTELVQTLKEVKVQQDKTIAEIKDTQGKVDTLKAKIVELEAVISAGGDASPELVDAVAAVKAAAQAADDAIPDLPAPTPTP